MNIIKGNFREKMLEVDIGNCEKHDRLFEGFCKNCEV